MYYNSYVYKFIDQLVQNLSSETEHYLFIKHYNPVPLTEESLVQAIPKDSDILLLCHEFSNVQMQTTYEPFLIWIRNLYFSFYQNVSPEDFIDACGVYPLHKSIFVSYLKNEQCIREEDLLLSEMDYERKRMTKSILSILSYLAASHPIMLFLNHAHCAQKSTLDLLNALVEQPPIKNFGCIVCYNEVSPTMPYAAKTWKALISQVEKKNHLIDWGTTERQQTITPTIQFTPQPLSFPGYISMIHNMVHTLAVEQANYYLGILYHKLEVERSFVVKELKDQILYLYSLTTLYSGDYSKALLLLEQLKELLDPDKNPVMYFEYIYLSGIAHIHNGLHDFGIKKSKECLAHLPEENKDYYIFKSHLLKYTALFKGWSTTFLVHMDNMKELCAEAEKYHYINHLAHIYTFGYGSCNASESDLSFLQKGVDLSLQLDNLAFALEVYKKHILVVSAYGHFDQAEQYYKKCIELSSSLNNPIEKANTYAGLGYNSTVSGDYEKANNYYNEAISIYYHLSALDPISEMLYNKSINAILAKDYEHSALYATKCLEILDKVKAFKLRVCNKSKLYGLAALSYIRLNSEYNCSLYLTSAKRYLSHLLDCSDDSKFFLWDDDLFLYYFTTGLLNKKVKDYSYAQSDFDHAYYHMMRSKGNLFFSYHQFAIEQAELYSTFGKEEEGQKLLEDCLAYAKEHKLKKQTELMHCVLEDKPFEETEYVLGMDNVSIEMIDELTNQVASQRELARKETYIDFLSTCQDMISQEQDKESLIQTTMRHIQNHFLLDQIILLSVSNGQLTPFYHIEECSLTEEQIDQIASKVSYYPNGFVVSRMEKRYEEFSDITSIFGTDEIASFVCIPIIIQNSIRNVLVGFIRMKENFAADFSPLTEGELTVLRFSFKQLVDSIDRIDFNQKILEYNEELRAMNNKLHQSAVTDILTSLLNRQGFIKLVDTNPSSQPDSHTRDMTVLYIDLDNFKYYNDTFGHAVGDLILVNFANILKKIAKDDHYAVRYGGDEFLLVLSDTSIEHAKAAAEAIYKELELQNYFLDLIPHDENVMLDIPKEHYISCSIGIACTDYAHGCNINETLKHADEALYDVKKHEKRAYRIWHG